MFIGKTRQIIQWIVHSSLVDLHKNKPFVRFARFSFGLDSSLGLETENPFG